MTLQCSLDVAHSSVQLGTGGPVHHAEAILHEHLNIRSRRVPEVRAIGKFLRARGVEVAPSVKKIIKQRRHVASHSQQQREARPDRARRGCDLPQDTPRIQL